MSLFRVIVLLGLSVLAISEATAEILNSNTPLIRIRIGDNGVGSVNTVIYSAGIPNEFAGVPGVSPDPQEISTTAIPGGSGVFEVRIVTDLNFRPPLNNPVFGATSLTGSFTYDSSSPMLCTTPASCGSTTIPFDKISWTTRDGDTLNTVLQYDNSAAQVFQTQVDANPATNRLNTRHRNYFRYVFDNDTLLPAGTYEGEVQVNGEGIF